MRRLTMRKWLAELRLTPEERRADCAERCMEVLYDSERAPHSSVLGEHEEAAIEAQRRRWSALHDRAARP
jgi:hypothetical protein